MTEIRDQVFISYSHLDQKWLDKVLTHFKPLVQKQDISVWSDKRIQAGSDWNSDIDQAISKTRIAILLVSPDFLASQFITEYELPSIFKAANNKLLRIFWIPLSASNYKAQGLDRYQAVTNPQKPLDLMKKAQVNEVLAKITADIADQLKVGKIREKEKAQKSLFRISKVHRHITIFRNGHGISAFTATLRILSPSFRHVRHFIGLGNTGSRQVRLKGFDVLKNASPMERFSRQTFFCSVLNPSNNSIRISSVDETAESTKDRRYFKITFEGSLKKGKEFQYGFGYSSPGLFPTAEKQLRDGSLRGGVMDFAESTTTLVHELDELRATLQFDRAYEFKTEPSLVVFDSTGSKLGIEGTPILDSDLLFKTYDFIIPKVKAGLRYSVRWKPK